MEHHFTFTKNLRIIFIAITIIGLLACLSGIFIYSSGRIWSNVLLNSFFFLSLALAGVFFVAVHIAGQSAWHTSIQRIPEAMGSFMPVAAILMLLILGGMHDLFHWTHTEHLDKVLEGKKPYLNVPFFIIRMIIYLAGWIFLAWKLRQLSVKNDISPDLKYFNKSRIWSGIFLVFFAITNSTSSWDWLMSVEPHWFSTLFAWYIFAGLFLAGIATIIIILSMLRSMGYMQHVRKEHIHDLGKYLFGISIFWMYLWFSQYMLIWYGNIPEETVYYVKRLQEFPAVFYLNIILNFAIPFLVLQPRSFVRSIRVLTIVSGIVLIGQWLNLYLTIMPGTIGAAAEIGIPEIGMTIAYSGIFLFVVFRALSKAKLIPANDPFYKESLEYHNI